MTERLLKSGESLAFNQLHPFGAALSGLIVPPRFTTIPPTDPEPPGVPPLETVNVLL